MKQKNMAIKIFSTLFIFFTFISYGREVPPNAKIQGRLNIINGASAECVMHKFYTGTGWRRIEGEIGRNGIDGLYYKEKYGNIKEVLVAESKWNKSRLGLSGKGKTVKQMSQEWVMRTMDKLVNKLHARIYKSLRDMISIELDYSDSSPSKAMRYRLLSIRSKTREPKPLMRV
jgi:hypothetical protein